MSHTRNSEPSAETAIGDDATNRPGRAQGNAWFSVLRPPTYTSKDGDTGPAPCSPSTYVTSLYGMSSPVRFGVADSFVQLVLPTSVRHTSAYGSVPAMAHTPVAVASSESI